MRLDVNLQRWGVKREGKSRALILALESQGQFEASLR